MAEAPATADAQAGAPSPVAQAPSASRVPPAGEPTAAQSSPQGDDRTPDERWDALVAGLPADVAAYVNRSKVPRIHLEQHEPGGKGTLWIKFDKALSKYAFAKAVAGEEVGGTRNVVQIMRAETRKAFGDKVQLAPTKKMADGQVAPPFGQLPADEQQRISAQIVKVSLSASLGAMSVGNNAKEPQTPPESGDTASADADEVHRAVPDAPDATVAHDRDNNRAVAQDTSRADAQSAVDPWALPEAGAGDAWSPTDGASHNVSRDVSRNAPQDEGHHAKHIVVPDLSDDTDPWANDGGNSMPVDGVRGGDAPGTPQNVAHAQSQSREDSERTNPGPTAVPESMSAEDPGLACRHQSLPLRRASPRQAQTPRQLSKGLPTTWLHPGARKTPESNRERRICSRLPVPRPVREHPALRMTTPIRSPEPTRMRRRTFPCRPWRRKTTNIR